LQVENLHLLDVIDNARIWRYRAQRRWPDDRKGLWAVQAGPPDRSTAERRNHRYRTGPAGDPCPAEHRLRCRAGRYP